MAGKKQVLSSSARTESASARVPDSELGKIHHGDCIAGMNALPAGSVDLVFADPPFNIGYDYDVYQDKKEYEHYLDWSREWISAVHRVLKPDGTFWLAIGDEYAAELKIESQKLGFHTRSWVIWYYTFGVNCKTKFSRSHAHLFHFVKDPTKFTFRSDEPENRIPSARLLVYGDSRGNPNGRLADDTWIRPPQDVEGHFTTDDDKWSLRPQDLEGRFTTEEDTWYFPRVAGTFKERAGFHGCQMPEQLLGRIIRLCSHENEIVLDPFSGSASTLIVAKKLKRQFLGFDLSPDYVQRGTQRLSSVRIGDGLDGSVEPTMSAPRTTDKRNSPKKPQAKAAQSPLETVLANAALAQEEWSSEAFAAGLIEAFRRVNEGFSLDRVIADPDLNAALANHCKAIGLPGDIRFWNRHLFRLRKAGKLSNIPTDRRTDLTWKECDSFLFASEIAWKQMLGKDQRSLDDILCDPDLAAEFVNKAGALAPDFKPWKYAWGALKIRKESKRTRARAGLLQKKPSSFKEPFRDSITALAKSLAQAPANPGVYLVIDNEDQQPLYAGESLNLRVRLTTQFDKSPLRNFWKKPAAELSVQYFTADADMSLLLAYQSLCVSKRRPTWNLIDPSLA